MKCNIEYCPECNAGTTHYNGKCGLCESKEAETAHREHFAILNSMTLEQRVRRLEDISYAQSVTPPWIEPRY